MNHYKQSSLALQRLRGHLLGYDDTPKEAKAQRVLAYLRSRKVRGIRTEQHPVGPYSGLTRQELRSTGTCETDWY
jgi:hypothetical protein